MIGHLQTNKIKTAVSLFDIIHSVDSLHLAEALSRRALKSVPVFLEVNVSGEPSKYGFSLAELPRDYEAITTLASINVLGLMTVAPQTADPEKVRPMFRRLRQIADSLDLRQLSIGMSDDFETAIACGATIVRIGTALFGHRVNKEGAAMGANVEAGEFGLADRQRFRSRLHSCLAALDQLLGDKSFDRPRALIGLEVEVSLADGEGAPRMVNEEVLAGMATSDFQSELGQFTLELNMAPRALAGRVFDDLAEEMRIAFGYADRVGARFGARSAGART
jgi:hypothetical protein